MAKLRIGDESAEQLWRQGLPLLVVETDAV